MTAIIDFSQIYLAPIFTDTAAKQCAMNPSAESKNMMTHFAINSVRSLYLQNKKNYGELVIACDSSSWRKDYFPNYKITRKQNREADSSGIAWDFVFELAAELKITLQEYFPFPIISYEKAEADDIIGALAKYKAENADEENMFGEVEAEPYLIISSDKDNFQLHRFKNVKQWSPLTKKLVKPDIKPSHALIEKIVRGDTGDSIPNIKTGDDFFKNHVKGESRQKPISENYLKTFFKAKNPIDACETSEERRNYERNEILISYEKTPENIYNGIISVYNIEKTKKHNKMKLMSFFAERKMNVLYSKISDFY